MININYFSDPDRSGTVGLGISSYFGTCSAPTLRAYQGKLASYRIAIIETTKESNMPLGDYPKKITKVQRIDAEEIRPDTCKIKLLPGKHQLVCSTEVGVRWYILYFLLFIHESMPQTLTIQAEAGHVYKICGGWDSSHTSMWIVDELTGAVVAGNKE